MTNIGQLEILVAAEALCSHCPHFPRIPDDFKAKIALLSAFSNGEFLRRSFDREPAGDRYREGFRMPAQRKGSVRDEGPASESLRIPNPREALRVFGRLWGFSGPAAVAEVGRRELRTADDCGLVVAAALDGVIEDWSVRSCRRLQARA